jgi:hypothetical protein
MTEPTEQTQAFSFDAWEKAGTHNILLHSGARVDIRIPDLAELIEAGEIPQHLLDTALSVANAMQTGQAPKLDKEAILRQKEFVDKITEVSVVKPKLTPDKISRVPVEDKELITEIATRARDVDAEGEHIAGLNKSEKWRRFRKVGEFDPDVAYAASGGEALA